MDIKSFDVVDEDSEVRYHPWSDSAQGGTAVGFECHKDGQVEYIYLNPSGGSDDDVANVFLYQGPNGDIHQDGAFHHYVVDPTDQTDLRMWDSNIVQFARLICEIVANIDLVDIGEVRDSMDVTEPELDALFARANSVWEAAKRQVAR